MNTIREVQRINEEELKLGIAGTRASWHSQYSRSAWIYVGNLYHGLVEGDLICVLSQYGEITDFHLVREEETGKSKGFAFCKYEDARSCILAVDNFCGIELCGRSLRVDHVENYRLPKHLLDKEEAAGLDITKPGLAYDGQALSNKFSLEKGQDLFAPAHPPPPPDERPNHAVVTVAAAADDDEALEQRRREKLKRKEERRLIREERKRKREKKSNRKEEKRHKRKKQLHDDDNEDDDDDNDKLDRSSKHKKPSKKSSKKSKRRSINHRRHDSSDDESSFSSGVLSSPSEKHDKEIRPPSDQDDK